MDFRTGRAPCTIHVCLRLVPNPKPGHPEIFQRPFRGAKTGLWKMVRILTGALDNGGDPNRGYGKIVGIIAGALEMVGIAAGALENDRNRSKGRGKWQES